MLAIAIPLGLVASDFVTGILHWIPDTYGSEHTPVLGPSVVKPFRLHHLYPRDICTHDLVETLGNSCILAVPALSLSLYLIWTMPESQWLAPAVVFLSILAIGTVLTNQFHKWAHQERPSAIVRWLQRARLVLGPAHHELHHTEPFNKHYCITNGWLNPVLNRVGFFRKIEAGLRLFGIEPSQGQVVGAGTPWTSTHLRTSSSSTLQRTRDNGGGHGVPHLQSERTRVYYLGFSARTRRYSNTPTLKRLIDRNIYYDTQPARDKATNFGEFTNCLGTSLFEIVTGNHRRPNLFNFYLLQNPWLAVSLRKLQSHKHCRCGTFHSLRADSQTNLSNRFRGILLGTKSARAITPPGCKTRNASLQKLFPRIKMFGASILNTCVKLLSGNGISAAVP